MFTNLFHNFILLCFHHKLTFNLISKLTPPITEILESIHHLLPTVQDDVGCPMGMGEVDMLVTM